MPIFDQGYQHWRGEVSGHAWRWLAVTRQGVRQQLGRRRTKWLVAVSFVPALALAAFLILWGLLEQKSFLIQPLLALIEQIPEEFRSDLKVYRGTVWTLAFDAFFGVETFFCMLLVLSVGPDLVSQDMRFNAMPLYFSRPLRRLDYFAGKLGVIGAFLASVAVAPAVAAYVLGVAFSLDPAVVRDTWRVLAGSVAFGLVVVVSAGTLMLAISSLSKNSRLVGATWVGFWIVSNVTAVTLMGTAKRDWCPLVSYTANLDRVREAILDTPAARRKVVELILALRAAGQSASRPRSLRERFFSPPPPPPTPKRFEDVDESEIPPPLRTPEHLRHPWTWSAGVLAGLFALSFWTLTTRVKSMDRLR